MGDSQCTVGGHRLCLLVIWILAFIIPANTHGASAQATTLSIEAIQALRTITVDDLKAFSKAEKTVNDCIHHEVADIAETVSRLEETMQVVEDKATSSVEAIQDLRTTVDQLKAFSKAETEVNNGIYHRLAVNTDTISRLEETLQVLKDEVKQKQSAPLKAENAHFVAIFDKTLANPGPIKFMPSSITAFGSKDGDETDLSANCGSRYIEFRHSGSRKWKEDPSTGRCYYNQPENPSEQMSWSDANERCKMEGGQLLSIGSPEEQNFINGMMKDIRDYDVDFSYWTGGRRIQGQLPSSDATGWEWSDGSPFKFTNWDSNQPDNQGGMQDCISFQKSTGQWKDVLCSFDRPSVCEKPGIIADGVFTAPISGVYELGFTAWTTMNRSIVDIIHNNNRIIASASANPLGKFGTNVIEELKAGDKVAVVLSQGAIGGQSEMRSAKLFGKLIDRS